MLLQIRCCGISTHLSIAAILMIMAVTMAAVCDWHSDLVYHPDCVLCHFAQLCLVSTSGAVILPPPIISNFETAQAPVLHTQISQTGECFFRGPPA